MCLKPVGIKSTLLDLRATLDYDKKVHRSRIVGKWSNMIGVNFVFYYIGFRLWPRLVQ